MKKFTAVLFVIAVLTVTAVFLTVCEKSGGTKLFMKTYVYNFKQNITDIAQKMNIDTSWFETLSKKKSEHDTDAPDKPEQNSDTEPIEEPVDESELSDDLKQNEIKSNKLVPLEEASTKKYAAYRNQLLCFDGNTLTAFDTSGNQLWSGAMSVAEPIFEINGGYILIAEKGGKKINVLMDKKLVYSVNTSDKIVTASISADGEVAAVTEKEEYRGAVVVYNKSGEEVFVWNSGKNTIIDADISSSRNIAVALLDTTSGAKATVNFFDINKTEPYSIQEFNDTVIFDVKFVGGVLNATADNKFIGMNSSGKIIYTNDFGGKTLTKYAISDSGFLCYTYDNSSYAGIHIYNKNGKEKTDIKSEELPDFLGISDNRIIYNNGRTLILGDFTGKKFKTYSAKQEIKNAVIVSSSSAVIVYDGSLEFCEF